MPRRLAEQTNTVRTQFTLNEVAICFASYRFALIILKTCTRLAAFKSSCTISRVEDFARSVRDFASCFKKMRNSKMKEQTKKF